MPSPGILDLEMPGTVPEIIAFRIVDLVFRLFMSRLHQVGRSLPYSNTRLIYISNFRAKIPGREALRATLQENLPCAISSVPSEFQRIFLDGSNSGGLNLLHTVNHENEHLLTQRTSLGFTLNPPLRFQDF